MAYQNLKQKIKYSFKSIFYIGVGKSLLIWFLAISFIPLASVSVINYLNSYAGLTVIAEKSLITTSQLRLEYIESFFSQKVDFLNIETKQEGFANLFDELKTEFDTQKSTEKYAVSQKRT